MTNTAQIVRTTPASLRLVHPLALLAEAFSTRRGDRRETAPPEMKTEDAGSKSTGEHDTGRRDPDARAEDRPPVNADELPPPRAATPIPLPGEPVDTSQHRPARPPEGSASAEPAPDRER